MVWTPPPKQSVSVLGLNSDIKTKETIMKKCNTISIDLAKSVFQVAVINGYGKIVSNKEMPRKRIFSFIASQKPSRIVMEACGSSNYWGRLFRELDHEVLLVAAQHVTPFVKGNKNDANDAIAIYEASCRPNMRFVSIKSLEQQDIKSIHNVRQRLVNSRKNLMNHARGLLSEYGIIFNIGVSQLRKGLVSILSGDISSKEITSTLIELTKEWYDELILLDKEITYKDKTIAKLARQSEAASRLMKVEGIGPVIATALVGNFGEKPTEFKNGRDMAAILGLTPNQHSSGGKAKLGAISKRGDKYLRTLLVNGATSVINTLGNKSDPKSQWLKKLLERKPANKVRIALANKMVRIAWVILARGETYKPELAACAAN